MATENVRVLKIDTDPAQVSVKELRTQLKELRSTMLSTEQGTDEYNEALRQCAEITHTLKEQTEEINASAMDFGQIAGNVTKSVGGIVAGFQAAKATLSLFGIENEAVLQSLQKMQNLMAITQALPAIDNGIKAFKRLGLAIKAAAAATTTFSKAMVATGIGAIVVAVGLLAANWDKVKAAITGTNEELDKQKQLKMDEYIQSVNEKLEKQWLLEKEIRGILGQNDLQIAAANVEFYNKKLEQSNNKIALFRSQIAGLSNDLARNRNAGKAQSVLDGIQEKIDGINDKIKQEEESQKSLNEQIKKAGEEYEKAKILDKARKIAQAQKDAEENAKKAREAAKKATEQKKKEAEEEAKAVQKLIEKYQTLKEKLEDFYNATSIIQNKKGGFHGFVIADIVNVDELQVDLNKALRELNEFSDDAQKTLKESLGKGLIDEKEYEQQLLRLMKYIQYTQSKLRKEYADKKKEERKSELDEELELTESAYNLGLAQLKQRYDEGEITYKEYLAQRKGLTDTYVEEYIAAIQHILDTEKGLTDEMILDFTNKINEARELLKEDTTTADGITEAINASALALNEFSDNPAWGKVLQNLAIISANWDEMHKNMQAGGKKAFSAYSQLAAASFGAIAAMLNGLAAEQDQTNKEGFESAKKFQIAGATMSMLAGIASAWASSMQLMFPANVIVGSILSAMMLGLGIAQIVKIKKQKFGGDSASGGGDAGGTPNTGAITNLIAPVQYTQDVQGASIEGAIKDTKVYVTETDISDTQDKVEVTESEARY